MQREKIYRSMIEMQREMRQRRRRVLRAVERWDQHARQEFIIVWHVQEDA